MESISVSIFGIWYLFLCIDLLRTLESNANFIVWSRLTVITRGEINYWSEQLFSFFMCPSSRSFLISQFTRSCRLMGTLLPFWCFGWKFLWNLDLTIWIFDQYVKWVVEIALQCEFWMDIEVWLRWPYYLHLSLGFWVTEIPRASNKSLPISGFSPSRTTTISASSIRHPLLAIGACIIPRTFMGSFANVLSSWGGVVINHRARGEFSTISAARDSVKILHTLPESMSSPTWVFPICN